MKLIQVPQKGMKRFWQANSERAKVSRSTTLLFLFISCNNPMNMRWIYDGSSQLSQAYSGSRGCYSCPKSPIPLLQCFSWMLKSPLFSSELLLPLIVQKGFLNAYLLPSSYNSCIWEERETSSFWNKMFIFSTASIDWGINKLRVLGINWLEQGWLTKRELIC